jgi:CHAT domain-containing protein
MLRLFAHFRVRRLLGVLFLSSLLLCLGLGQIPWQSGLVVALTVDAKQQVQRGVDRYRAGEYRGAIELWKTALQEFQKTDNKASQAIVRGNLARAYQQIGQSQQAISQWEEVVQLYRHLGNHPQVARALTEEAQVYSRIGQHRKAIALLCNANDKGQCSPNSALELAVQSKDTVGEAAALGALGNAYRLIGQYELAKEHLEASQRVAEKLGSPGYQLSALNSLGILSSSRAQVNYRKAEIARQSGDRDGEASDFETEGKGFDQQAIAYLQRSLNLAQAQNNNLEQLRSLLTLIPTYARTSAANQARESWQTAKQLLEKLPDSRDRVFMTINLAQLLAPNAPASSQQCLSSSQLAEAEPLLQSAAAVAQRIQDSRAESFALGELGQLYECQKKFAQALEVTQQARFAADQNLEAKDSLYLWEWQAGRILKQQWELMGKSDGNLLTRVIAAYERATATLESIRGDILTATRDVQFDFRDTIDPIYRELVELKLSRETPVQAATKQNSDNGNQKNFRSILRTIDNLKLAELQNYFGNDCVVAAANQESIDLGAKTAAAVFNTIILENQTAIIVSLPNGQQVFNWIDIPRQQLIDRVNTFRIGLEDTRFNYDPKPAQQVYDWIVRPFETELEQAKVNTLVFVQDGIFRTVPMAALHDGKQFLIQRYAIATTPSLTLTDPKPLKRANLRVLALGLTKAANLGDIQFKPLPKVGKELTSIEGIIPGSKKLLDADFTPDRLRQELSATVYPILHVATHGKFATDPGDTFIVTGNQKKLTFNQLDQLIRTVSRNTEPLELLFLTACETAAGNDRSALGLAGVAVQAGARSALATLWTVNDSATAELAAEFYTQLRQPQFSKAQALQAAQRAILEGKVKVEGVDATHPAYWSPFVLIGNWL